MLFHQTIIFLKTFCKFVTKHYIFSNEPQGLTEAEESVSESFRAIIEDRLIPMLALDRFFWHKWDDYKVGTYYELDILNMFISLF